MTRTKKIILIVFALLFILAGVWYTCFFKAGRTLLSSEQRKAQALLGNSTITFNDPHLNRQMNIEFSGQNAKTSDPSQSNKAIDYKITDLLPPVNLDKIGAVEYPFILNAVYPDGKNLDYLVIAHKSGFTFRSVDQALIGPASQIDSINSSSDTEVVIEAFVEHQISSGETIKDKAMLTYTFQADKIVPGKNNIDISKKIVDPRAVEKPASLPTPKASSTPSPTPKPATGKGKIALTFDDGPGAYTPKFIDTLNKYGIKATFFMIGENAESRTDTVKQVHAAGEEIGNHTYDHQDLKKLSYDGQYDEINKTNNILKGLISTAPHWMRPPYGNFNDDTTKVLNALGMQKALWNVDTRDWSGLSADDIRKAALAGAKDGAIILMHDGVANSTQTLQALPDIIQSLQSQGYTLVKLSEL